MVISNYINFWHLALVNVRWDAQGFVFIISPAEPHCLKAFHFNTFIGHQL